MFDSLKTGIDGLDAILAGGIRYPADTAAFVFVTGGPGSGKTVLALELLTRAWLEAGDSSTCLYYSVEHSPESLQRKLEYDFAYYGYKGEIRQLEKEVPNKLCLEVETDQGVSRLVLTQTNPAGIGQASPPGTVVDVDWILAEIGNYRLAGPVKMACVDNIGLLLSDLDYFGKRSALLATRRELMSKKIHGIFVQEITDARDLRLPSAEEFSTDLLIELGFQEELGSFKARSIEISKARHQYYYRGVHHFSIAGRGINLDGYLGARSERGPGIHIYPSVAAQLSIARDNHPGRVPPRGRDVIDMGHPDLIGGFHEGAGPTARSSTVILAEPGTRYTYLALRFLAAGRTQGETTLQVSTNEDEDALARICRSEESLTEHCLKEDGEQFAKNFRVLYLHPEFISPGKFTWDLMRLTEPTPENPRGVTRLAFDNIYRLEDRFPLLANQNFMIPALLDMLRYRGVTPLFIDLVPPGSAKGGTGFDPATYMTNFDNVLHLFLEEVDDSHRPFLRILKSPANQFTRRALPLDYDRD